MRELHELPYAEIVKYGTIRFGSKASLLDPI